MHAAGYSATVAQFTSFALIAAAPSTQSPNPKLTVPAGESTISNTPWVPVNRLGLSGPLVRHY